MLCVIKTNVKLQQFYIYPLFQRHPIVVKVQFSSPIQNWSGMVKDVIGCALLSRHSLALLLETVAYILVGFHTSSMSIQVYNVCCGNQTETLSLSKMWSSLKRLPGMRRSLRLCAKHGHANSTCQDGDKLAIGSVQIATGAEWNTTNTFFSISNCFNTNALYITQNQALTEIKI